MTATATTTATVAIPRSDLARALKAAASIKAKAVHLDLTAERVTVSGYTSAVATRVTLDVAGESDAGSGAVPRALLAGVLPYLGHDVRLAFGENQLEIRSGESTFEIRTLRPSVAAARTGSSKRWRQVGDLDASSDHGHDLSASGEAALTFEAPVLVETLRRALPFASKDQTRPVLCNVAFYSGVAAATDSYRLAVVSYGDGAAKPEGETEPTVMINTDGGRSLRALLARKLGTVTVTTTPKFLLVDFEDTRWSLLRTLDKDGAQQHYPKWWELLPDAKPAATIKVDREDLLTGSRAATVMARRNAPLRLRTRGVDVDIEAHTPDSSAMTRRLASAECSGEDMECGFNPAFLADLCAAAPVERLTVKLIGPLKPALIEAARDRYLLMPIRLNV